MPYRSIDDPTKLRRLLEATLLLEGDLELPALLRHVIDEARSMTGARYAALGVLNEDRTALAEFITLGLDDAQEEQIGARPTGEGVLGLLIADPRPLRVGNLEQHAERSGFPPHHPPMTSFLGVPIKVRDEIYGNLYLTDKIGWSEFTNDDVVLVETLALAAGIAIENTRLHHQVQVAAVFDDRDRLARDLHDTVIQRLFGVGLTLQSMAARAAPDVAKGLGAATEEIDGIIHQVRSTIYELGMSGQSRGLRDDVVALGELHEVLGFEAEITFEGPVDTAISGQVVEHLLATVREAVTNIGRHARATWASVNLSVDQETCRLLIVDNGVGFDPSEIRDGALGLFNLRRRAEKLNGTFVVADAEGGGSSLLWQVPLPHRRARRVGALQCAVPGRSSRHDAARVVRRRGDLWPYRGESAFRTVQ